MTNLKAINTKYKGYNFRSRLEARWAIFFDALNIMWEYELEGFDLDGTYYLPDFYLPDFGGGTYVEVKPEKLSDSEKLKCEKLCIATKKDVWLAVGVPDTRDYFVIMWDKQLQDFIYIPAIPLIHEAQSENRMYTWPMDIVDLKGFIKVYQRPFFTNELSSIIYPHLYKAVEEAKSARFEFL